MNVLETARLTLRRLTPEDAPFILELVNEPSWLQFIGDKGVHTLDDARGYIQNGPMDMYARLGFGLYLVQRKDAAPMGICGLIKRPTLEDVDIGFAFRPAFWGQGYARESAAAVLDQGRDAFKLKRIVAITSPGNLSSIRLLEKLGFQFERELQLSPGDPVKLFAWLA